MGWMTSAAIVGLLGVAVSSASLGACGGGAFADSGDGGTEGGTSGSSGGTSGTSGGASGTSGTSGSTSGVPFDAGGPVCNPASVPNAAVAAVAIKFDAFDAGGTANAWRSIGFDRDNLCTTKDSIDVCMRVAGAPSANQEDGDNGIDNAWGHTISPLFGTIGPTTGTGYLTTDATGGGTLRLTTGGGPMNVPVTSAKVVRQGTTATVSVIIPTEAFVTELARVAGHLSTSLCSGSALASIEQSIRQASDMPLMGSQSPGVTCAAISFGATLTGVVDGMAPVIDAGPDPCM
jgi:hypothetical protein